MYLLIYFSVLPLENFHHFSLPSPRASSSSPSKRYNVFPSYRGLDVRYTLFSSLYRRLHSKSITTFTDQDIMKIQDIRSVLSPIRESRISIVIFSINYASSQWCLDELVEIHECKKKFDLKVIPIFYHVDPSEVREQTGTFGEGFKRTCMRLHIEYERKVRWMHALAEVANLVREDLQNW